MHNNTDLSFLPVALFLHKKAEERRTKRNKHRLIASFFHDPGQLSRRSFRHGALIRISFRIFPRGHAVFTRAGARDLLISHLVFFPQAVTFPLEFAVAVSGRINYFLVPAPVIRSHHALIFIPYQRVRVTLRRLQRCLRAAIYQVVLDYYIFLRDECHRAVSWRNSRCTHCDLHANWRRYAPDNELAAVSCKHTQALILGRDTVRVNRFVSTFARRGKFNT